MRTKQILVMIMSVIILLSTSLTSTAQTIGEFLADTSITIPANSELFVGEKEENRHFVDFTEIIPQHVQNNELNDTVTYFFELEDSKTYNYRVSSENQVTYGGIFEKTAGLNFNITEEMLNSEGKNKTTVDRNLNSNSGYNVGDIYLNINHQGHLKLNTGETYQIVPLRNWETVNSTVDNYFIEPDFSFTVIDENGNLSTDVIEIDDNGLITALKKGTAIVLVTYDSINLNYGNETQFYGAVWPENTGVFVVSVDASGFDINMTINEGKNDAEIKLSGDFVDAEHDVIYFIGESGEYIYTPQDNVTVSVANPVITETVAYNGFDDVSKQDGSYKIPLLQGRNIVKVQKNDITEYQIITAKSVSVNINEGEAVYPGDTLKIVFETLYHPSNKLAGVYNMESVAVYESVYGYHGKVVGGLPAQYDFAASQNAQSIENVLKEKDVWGQITYEKDNDLVIPSDYPYDTFVLSDGKIYVTGWGDPYGSHRNITKTEGRIPNSNYDPKQAWFGKLPDIEVEISPTSAPLTEIEVDTENVKTDYFAGEKFDSLNLVVTAIYEDSTTQIATNYEISPQILTEDTKKVVVSYRGMQKEIDVSVTEPKVTSIELTKAPDKVKYITGDTFSPEGMVISAIYENGDKRPTLSYTYSPNRELLRDDSVVTVTYTGEDTLNRINSLNVPITVESGDGIQPNTINVTVTVLGDTKHGTPTSNVDIHTMKGNNLRKWVSNLRVTINAGANAFDVIKKALGISGIPYSVGGGNYIKSVNGLSELDNGSLSGWMFTVNGSYPAVGMDHTILKNNDSIVLHYTDDFMVEWTVVTPQGGTSLSSKEESQEEITEAEKDLITMPVSEKEFNETTFTDVKKDQWYYDSVRFVYEKNIMQGTGKGFEPEVKMTRAMLVTVLYRMENIKNQHMENKFSDVEKEAWYFDAVAWATQNGIVTGTGDNVFSPDEEISREQLAVIIYRYAIFKGHIAKNKAELSEFSDADKISDWAIDAMAWANSNGIVSGTSDVTLSPKESTTRAQGAAMLMRLIEEV